MKNKRFSAWKESHYEEIRERLVKASEATPATVLHNFNSGLRGLNESTAKLNRERYGCNKFNFPQKTKKEKKYKILINPVTIILSLFFVVALVAVIIAGQGASSWITLGVIFIAIIISLLENLRQYKRNYRKQKSLELLGRVSVTCVEREGAKVMLPLEKLVAGDIVHLRAGDIIPADVRILTSNNFVLNQSQLTGLCMPVKKSAVALGDFETLTDRPNLAFMGSAVISGSAAAAVIVTGGDTVLGKSWAK